MSLKDASNLEVSQGNTNWLNMVKIQKVGEVSNFPAGEKTEISKRSDALRLAHRFRKLL